MAQDWVFRQAWRGSLSGRHFRERLDWLTG
jgi:hypothetical protein